MQNFLGPYGLEFLLGLILSFLCGIIIGGERELKRKPAGINTQTLVIGASMLFSFLSKVVPHTDPTRIAAQIVTGVGFLGAGIILRSEASKKVSNLTTAASIWYASAIGMAIGYDYYLIAILATLYAVVISRLPKIISDEVLDDEEHKAQQQH